MIKIKLKEIINQHREKTGKRLTYGELSKRTGISEHALQSMAIREGYNPTLANIDALCKALNCKLTELLEFDPKK